MYGYRVEEVPELEPPGNVKQGTFICKVDYEGSNMRRVVRASIGVHVLHASLPHGDPEHPLTVSAGVFKRVARELPPPDQRIMSKFQKFVRKWLKNNFIPLPTDSDTSVERWLEHSNYTIARRSELLSIAGGNRERDGFAKCNTKLKCFVKDEGYLEYKHVRNIYARCDEFKVRVGPIFKLIEENLYANPYFIKHISSNERARFINQRFGVVVGVTGQGDSDVWRIVGSDYTAFESHFTRRFMEVCEFQLYHHASKNLPEHVAFMQYCRRVIGGKNSCKFKRLQCEIKCSRMSGEMNTSLGNGFSNLMIFLFLMDHYKCRDYDCLIEGDDCLAIYRGKLLPENAFTQLGFTAKVNYFTKCNYASFCGQVYDDTYVVITDPLKQILNVGWVSQQYQKCSQAKKYGLLRSKALSIYHQYKNCPILSVMAYRMLSLTIGHKEVVDCSLSNYVKSRNTAFEGGVTPPPSIQMSSRVLMAEVFGFSVEEQLCLEEYFKTMEYGPIDHWLIYFKCHRSYLHFNLNYVMPNVGRVAFEMCQLGKHNIYKEMVKNNMQRKRAKRATKRLPMAGPVRANKAPKPQLFNAVDSGGALGTSIGNSLVPGVGGAIGGILGKGLGFAFRKITGKGDYQVSENTLVKPMPVPSFGDHCIRVKNVEYIGDISSTTAFANTLYSINPGLLISFPWLSNIAKNYEQYRWNGLVYNFVSTSATALNSTNTALGKLIMATDYNALSPAYPNSVSMLQSEFSNYGKPAENLMHAIECAPGQRPTELLFVRSTAAPLNSDIRLYDIGNFQIATEGMQASANIGGLWVSYDITFCKPVLGSVNYSIPSVHYRFSGNSGQGLFGSPVLVAPIQFSGLVSFTSILNTSTITFNAAADVSIYQITYFQSGGNNNLQTIPTYSVVNATLMTVFDSTNSLTLVSNGVPPPSGAYCLFSLVVSLSVGVSVVTISGFTTPLGGSTGDIIITQLNSGLF